MNNTPVSLMLLPVAAIACSDVRYWPKADVS